MIRETTLLLAARKMDGDALREVFELYAPALYKYGYRLCNHAGMADQLVGEVFDRFIQQLSSSRSPGVNLRVCLYEIAYNILSQDVRYTYYFWSANGIAPSQSEPWPIAFGVDDQRLLDAIQRALIDDLTDDQRHVIILRFVEGFSLKETAAIIGKKLNNVKVIQNRAIATLRKALGYQEVETHTITLFIRRMAQA